MEASKWLKIPMLIDDKEMENLFHTLGTFQIFNAGMVTNEGEGEIPQQKFLEIYKNYIDQLQNGLIPNDSLTRPYFSSIFSLTPDVVFAMPLDGNRQLLRVARPAVQLQNNAIGYSPLEGKFRSTVFGTESITWGIQFSYPQLFREEDTQEVKQVLQDAAFPNTALFHNIQKWSRQQTIPTPFVVNSEKINVPIRLGKNCLSWINRHPQLLSKNISVVS